MIYTLTLNPCTDKTVTVENFEIGATNRVVSYKKEICGKGINTSVVIKNLGYDVFAFSFEYENGDSVKNFLASKEISNHCIKVKGELRTNVKVYDPYSGITTEINEKGGNIPKEKLAEMIGCILATVKSGDIFVMSGSVPDGVSHDIYGELTKDLKARGVYTILDADGELLANGITACPNMIKPNRDELSALLKKEIKTKEAAVSAAKELCARGIEGVCVSLGKDGSVLVRGNEVIHAFNDLKQIKGTVGAGDSMIAGFAIGAFNKLSSRDTLQMASACAAGSVSLPFTELCTLELYNQMLDKVRITTI